MSIIKYIMHIIHYITKCIIHTILIIFSVCIYDRRRCIVLKFHTCEHHTRYKMMKKISFPYYGPDPIIEPPQQPWRYNADSLSSIETLSTDAPASLLANTLKSQQRHIESRSSTPRGASHSRSSAPSRRRSPSSSSSSQQLLAREFFPPHREEDTVRRATLVPPDTRSAVAPAGHLVSRNPYHIVLRPRGSLARSVPTLAAPLSSSFRKSILLGTAPSRPNSTGISTTANRTSGNVTRSDIQTGRGPRPRSRGDQRKISRLTEKGVYSVYWM